MTVLNIIQTSNTAYWIVLGIAIAALTAGIIVTIKSGFEGIILVIVMAILGIAAVVRIIENPPRLQYQVTIDEKTTFHEIYDKYEVVEQDGLIYTIEERKEKNAD